MPIAVGYISRTLMIIMCSFSNFIKFLTILCPSCRGKPILIIRWSINYFLGNMTYIILNGRHYQLLTKKRLSFFFSVYVVYVIIYLFCLFFGFFCCVELNRVVCSPFNVCNIVICCVPEHS